MHVSIRKVQNTLTKGTEDRILLIFFRTSGIDLGIYDPSKRVLRSHNSLSEGQKGLYETNVNQIKELMKKGWSEVDLSTTIRKAYSEKIKTSFIQDLIPKDAVSSSKSLDRNLVEPGVAYNHKVLRIVDPPRVKNGVITPGAEVKYTEVFTLSNLINYYSDKTGRIVDPPRVAGIFSYLLEGADLDTILYSIDLGVEKELNLSNPLKIQDLYLDAEQELKHRKRRFGRVS